MRSSRGQKWYAEGLRFECQRCGACCTGEPGYVWVAPREAARIAEFLGVSCVEFAREYLRKTGRYDSLIEMPEGRCVFYTDKACTIYPVRPVQCRTFPFWRSIIVSPEAWWRAGQECPGVGKGKLYSAAEVEKVLRQSEAGYGRPQLHLR